MVIVAIRAIILYVFLLIAMRIMGKGDLGELQPFDLVVSLMLAELAVMPMEDLDAPLLHGFMAISVIMFLQCLISYISLKSHSIRKIINGSPSIIYDHGKFNVKDMNKLRVDMSDILSQVRLKGYYSFEDIDYVIMETNGDVSVVAPDSQPGERCKRLPISVVLDGRVMHHNLKKFNISKDELDRNLKKSKLKPKEVLYGFVDENDKFVFYKR
ncbi:MAG: DUF421 domain-containing protein [Tissierellia bacterium]|nr:DUF421 domain-containing protein [Tissierellia bacterium]